FVAGSVPGLFVGSALTRQLPRALLSKIFAAMILAVAVFVIARTIFG
ncbi:MAG: sulfite exporter TauE/SafE family protein, partial [Planctomycetia bacterium]|nr:sulfite exporter TauE/SafE family protein [Planctomycetia bacterium]